MGSNVGYTRLTGQPQAPSRQHEVYGDSARPATLPLVSAPTRVVLGQSAAATDNPLELIPAIHFQRTAQSAPKLFNWWVTPEQLHGAYSVSDNCMYISLRLPVPIVGLPILSSTTHVTIAYKAEFTSLQWYQYKNWTRVLLARHLTTAVMISRGSAFYVHNSEFLAMLLLLQEHIYKVGATEMEGTRISEDAFHVTWNAP